MSAVDSGELMQGQRYDEQADLVIPYTEQMMHDDNADALVGQARTEITPNDAHMSKVRIWGTPSGLASVYFRTSGSTNLSLPDVLTSITSSFSKNAGEGEDEREVGLGIWLGDSGGLNFNPQARANGSASIVPDVIIDIEQTWGQNVPTDEFFFYIDGNVTTAAVLERLTTILTLTVSSVVAGVVTTSAAHGLSLNEPVKFPTVVGGTGGIATNTTYYVKTIPSTTTFTYSATAGGAALSGHAATSGTVAPVVSSWPQFRPKAHTLTLKGQQVSVQASAEVLMRYSFSSGAYSVSIAPYAGTRAGGISKEVGTNVRSVRVPPTIHGEITIASATDTAVVTATATAYSPAITGIGGAPSYSAITNTETSSITATGAISPTTLAATSGVTAIPTAGLYILDISAQPYRIGLAQVRVTLVNFNAFA